MQLFYLHMYLLILDEETLNPKAHFNKHLKTIASAAVSQKVTLILLLFVLIHTFHVLGGNLEGFQCLSKSQV